MNLFRLCEFWVITIEIIRCAHDMNRIAVIKLNGSVLITATLASREKCDNQRQVYQVENSLSIPTLHVSEHY